MINLLALSTFVLAIAILLICIGLEALQSEFIQSKDPEYLAMEEANRKISELINVIRKLNSENEQLRFESELRSMDDALEVKDE